MHMQLCVSVQVSSLKRVCLHGLGSRAHGPNVLPDVAGGWRHPTCRTDCSELTPSTGLCLPSFSFQGACHYSGACRLCMNASGQRGLAARGWRQLTCRCSPLSLTEDHLHSPLPPPIPFVNDTLCSCVLVLFGFPASFAKVFFSLMCC